MENYKDFDKNSLSYWNKKMYKDIACTMLQRLENINEKALDVENSIVLDVGSGCGSLSYALLQITIPKKLLLLDLRNDALIEGKNHLKSDFPDMDIDIINADVSKIPLEKNAIDLIISRGSVNLWDEQEKSFRELIRILKKGGLLYVGGGKGSPEFQELRRKNDSNYGMDGDSRGGNFKYPTNSKALENQFYEKLFNSLKVKYKIFDKEGDGRWFCIKK